METAWSPPVLVTACGDPGAARSELLTSTTARNGMGTEMWNSSMRLNEHLYQTITSSTIDFMSQFLKSKILLGFTE